MDTVEKSSPKDYNIRVNKIRKILIVICGFFFIQLILGVNNYERSGKFYLLTADTKLDLHRDLVEIVMSKKSNITRKDFAINEGKVVFKWIKIIRYLTTNQLIIYQIKN